MSTKKLKEAIATIQVNDEGAVVKSDSGHPLGTGLAVAWMDWPPCPHLAHTISHFLTPVSQGN